MPRSDQVRWPDGAERCPSGKRAREVPFKHPFSSSVWVAKDGEVWRRFYNVLSAQWNWDQDGPLEYAEDSNGRVGMNLGSQFRPIATVIALAWLQRAPETQARAELIEDSGGVHLENIQFAEAESNVETGSIADERFKPLKNWKCGVVPCPKGYMISSHGRLKSPNGEITSGFWIHDGACGPTRVAAAKGCGLIDLFVAAKLIPSAVHVTPCIKTAADFMMNGKLPKEHSRTECVKLDTSYCYFRQALAALKLPRAAVRELGETLISPDLWRLLVKMCNEDDDRLAGKLTMLMQVLEDELPESSRFWRVECQMGMLGLARQLVVALA